MQFAFEFEEVPLRIAGSAVDVLAYGIAEIHAHGYGRYEVESIRLNGDAGDVEIFEGHVLWPMLAPSILISKRGALDARFMDVEAAMPRRRDQNAEHRMQQRELV